MILTRLEEEVAEARARLDRTLRKFRSPDDPAVVRARETLEALVQRLDRIDRVLVDVVETYPTMVDFSGGPAAADPIIGMEGLGAVERNNKHDAERFNIEADNEAAHHAGNRSNKPNGLFDQRKPAQPQQSDRNSESQERDSQKRSGKRGNSQAKPGDAQNYPGNYGPKSQGQQEQPETDSGQKGQNSQSQTKQTKADSGQKDQSSQTQAKQRRADSGQKGQNDQPESQQPKADPF